VESQLGKGSTFIVLLPVHDHGDLLPGSWTTGNVSLERPGPKARGMQKRFSEEQSVQLLREAETNGRTLEGCRR
jgi:hypothetical protein